MKRSALSGCGITCIVFISWLYAKDLSLSEAQALLLTNNSQLSAAWHSKEKQTVLMHQVKASLQPQVSASASYGIQSQTSRISFQTEMTNPLTGLPVPIAIDRDLGDNDRTELGLDVSYPLFTGFSRLRNVEQAQHSIKAEESRYRSLKNQLLFSLGVHYIAWDVAIKKVAVQENLGKQIDEHTRRIEQLLAGGVVVNADVLKAKAASAKAQVGLLAAQNSADSLRIAIAAIIGLDETDVFPAPLDPETMRVLRPADSITALNRDRPELAIIHENKKQIASLQKALFGQRLPFLAATAGLRYADPGLAMGGTGFMGYGVAGLKLSWTLYDGMANRYQRASLTKQAAMLDDQEKELVVAWQAAMDQTGQACRTADQMLQATKQSLAASQAYMKDIQHAQEAGTATVLDYLQALTDNSAAAFEYERAQSMVLLSALQLRFAAGEEITY
jgi:outer membrane protein TolC